MLSAKIANLCFLNYLKIDPTQSIESHDLTLQTFPIRSLWVQAASYGPLLKGIHFLFMGIKWTRSFPQLCHCWSTKTRLQLNSNTFFLQNTFVSSCCILFCLPNWEIIYRKRSKEAALWQIQVQEDKTCNLLLFSQQRAPLRQAQTSPSPLPACKWNPGAKKKQTWKHFSADEQRHEQDSLSFSSYHLTT